MLFGIGGMPWTTRLAFGAIVSPALSDFVAAVLAPGDAVGVVGIGAQAQRSAAEASAASASRCMWESPGRADGALVFSRCGSRLWRRPDATRGPGPARSGVANVGDRRCAEIGALEPCHDTRCGVVARGELARFLEAHERGLLGKAGALGTAQLHLHVGVDHAGRKRNDLRAVREQGLVERD